MTMTSRMRRWCRRDDGAMTPMVVVLAASIFAMVGLSVDGGGEMRTTEHADNLAAEAARAGGQAIDLGQAVSGTADVVDPVAAVKAAKSYLASAGVAGEVTISANQREITVVVHITYHPVMLDLLGLGPWTKTGTATAELVTQ